MLSKVKALWNLFRAGEAVADPAMWKSRQVNGTMIAAVIICLVQLLKAFNVEIPIDNEAATAIGAGIVAAINIVLTITTSKTVGVSATGIVRANESSVPSLQQSDEKGDTEEALQVEHVSGVPNSGIDGETRRRAEQWAKQQSANGLARPEA